MTVRESDSHAGNRAGMAMSKIAAELARQTEICRAHAAVNINLSMVAMFVAGVLVGAAVIALALALDEAG
jgi:hypothetical protein